MVYHDPSGDMEELWYGALMAHLISGTARDLLAHALLNLDAAGFEIVLHVHDEVVAEVDADKVDLDLFERCMLDVPDWAAGLPLAAKVRASDRYIKADAPIETKASAIVETSIAVGPASIQPQDGGDADSDFHAGDLPLETERHPDHDGNEQAAAHLCAQCRLNPPDGSEQARRLDNNENLWLHKHCEDAFIRRRMAEEGILEEVPTAKLPPTAGLDPTDGDNRKIFPRGKIALALAAQGFRVFPLIPRQKTPAIKGWPQRATTDAKQIREWWTGRDYNIGIATGRADDDTSGPWLVVVDYDCKDGKVGGATLEAHEAAGYTDTFSVKTPHGRHSFYWSEKRISNSVSRVAQHVDVRCHHGYVVAVGSEANGKKYGLTPWA